jgi:hypothetical protein
MEAPSISTAADLQSHQSVNVHSTLSKSINQSVASASIGALCIRGESYRQAQPRTSAAVRIAIALRAANLVCNVEFSAAAGAGRRCYVIETIETFEMRAFVRITCLVELPIRTPHGGLVGLGLDKVVVSVAQLLQPRQLSNLTGRLSAEHRSHNPATDL